MEIKVEIFGHVYSLLIGRETDWYESIYFINLIEEFYENKEVVYARDILSLFPEKV